MTDRNKGCFVAFDRDIRSDDVEPLVHAIMMLKGVSNVSLSVVDGDDWINRQRIRDEIGRKLLDVVYPKDGK